MKRLTKAQEKSFRSLLADLDEKQDDLRDAVSSFHDGRSRAFDALKAAVEAFNHEQEQLWGDVESAREDVKAALEEIEVFRDGVANDLACFFDEKSEKWQESDAGTAFIDWRDKWDSTPEIDLQAVEDSPSEVEIEEPEELNIDLDSLFYDVIAQELPLDVDGNDIAEPEARRPKPAVPTPAPAPPTLPKLTTPLQETIDQANGQGAPS